MKISIITTVTIILTLVTSASLLTAQDRILFKDPKPYESDRYKDIKGEFYLFEDWVTADITDKMGGDYANVLVNYDGYEDNVEAYDGKGNFLNLSPTDYTKIVITDSNETLPKDLKFSESLTLIRSPHPSLHADYYLLLHQDGANTLLAEYSVSVSTVTERPPGEIIEKKRFNKRFKPVLITGDKIQKFGAKKKEVKKAFAAFGDITKWCKSNKQKATSFEGMVAFLKAQS